MTCVVCLKTIEGNYIYHLRLNAYICGSCPLTNVKGEDVSEHCMYYGVTPELPTLD